ncbi:ankyrin repeat-containing domain protein [Gorgonomyces haynaldii]|nr:ankyrin repeat-containing domain protein [Gorgonomyces haynaldii]
MELAWQLVMHNLPLGDQMNLKKCNKQCAKLIPVAKTLWEVNQLNGNCLYNGPIDDFAIVYLMVNRYQKTLFDLIRSIDDTQMKIVMPWAIKNGHAHYLSAYLSLDHMNSVDPEWIVECARYNSLECLDLLAQQGISSETALSVACSLGHVNCYLHLSKMSQTDCLEWTIQGGSVELLQVLMATQPIDKVKSLLLSIKHQQPQILQFLLNQGFLNRNQSFAVVLECCKSGTLEMLQLLMQHDCEMVGTESPLLEALLREEYEMADVLFQYSHFKEWRDADGNCIFLRMALHWLLQRNVKIDTRNNDGFNAIELACIQNSVKMCEYLLSCGWNIEKLEDDETILTFALKHDCEPIVELLIAKGVNVNPPVTIPPLCLAILNDNHWLVHLLVEAGSAVDHPMSPLLMYIERQNMEMVAYLLSQGCRLNITDDAQRSPLELAAMTGNLEIVELLVDYGLPVTNSALFLASTNGHGPVISFLLSRGACLDGTCSQSDLDKMLSSACEHGLYDFAKQLLDHGANPQVIFNDWNCLQHSSHANHPQIVRLLLQHGCSPITKHHPPLFLSCATGSSECCRLLLDHGAPMDYIDAEGLSLLDAAILSSSLPTVRLLVERGIPLSDSPLLLSLQHQEYHVFDYFLKRTDQSTRDKLLIDVLDLGDTEALELLYKHGCDLYQVVNDQPIQWIPILSRHLSILQFFITHQAMNVHKHGQTPLMLACSRNDLEICRLLIPESLVSQKDNNGRSCLDYTLDSKCNPDLLRLLIQHGCELKEAHLLKACQLKRPELVQLLLENGLRSEMCFRECIIQGHHDLVTVFLKQGQDPNDNHPLALAARHGKAQVCQVLLEHGSDVDCQFPETPLLLACEKGYDDASRILLSFGASLNVSRNSRFPLHFAVVANQTQFAQDILERDPSTVNASITLLGQTYSLLQYCLVLGRQEMADLLVKHGATIPDV